MRKNLLFFTLTVFIFSFNIFACGENCAMHSKEILKTEEKTLTGTIICMHCQLKEGEKCKPALKADDGKIFEICPDSLKDKKIDEHSKVKVEIKGKIGYPKEGNAVIHIKELKEIK